MLDISPSKLLVLATIVGVILAVAVAVVLIVVQAPEELKNLVPIAGIVPTVVAGLLKLFNRIDQLERNSNNRMRRTERKADAAMDKADEAMQKSEDVG